MSSLLVSMCPKCKHFLCPCVQNVNPFCVHVSWMSTLFVSMCPKCQHFKCPCVLNVNSICVHVSYMSTLFTSMCPKCQHVFVNVSFWPKCDLANVAKGEQKVPFFLILSISALQIHPQLFIQYLVILSK